MADCLSNGGRSPQQSSPIAKRLKTTTTDRTTESSDTGTKVAPKDPKRTTSTTSGSNNTTGKNDAKPPASLKAISSRSTTGTSERNLSPLEDENILHHIFSYVGDFQYLFIGSVNSKFEKSYVSLFPKKTTHFNASTIENTKSCWNEINKCKDDEKNDKMKHMLWHSAARYGKIDIVKYLLELLPPIQKNVSFEHGSYYGRHNAIDWKYDLCCTAAKYGQMEVLQWACDENICVAKDDSRVCVYAFGNGHFDLFQWAIKNGFCFDDDDDARVAAFEASRRGNLVALKRLQDEYEMIQPLQIDSNCGCSYWAAAFGQLDILKWIYELYEDRCWDNFTRNGAICGGHLSIVQYLLDIEGGWGMEPYYVAAFFGQLSILQLLRSSDPDWDEGGDPSVIAHAAAGGHLEIIEWASENGWPMTESACQYAAGFGQLDILKWLRARGCPWDSDTTTYASTDEIYEWSKGNGCPVTKDNLRRKLRLDFDLDDTSNTPFW